MSIHCWLHGLPYHIPQSFWKQTLNTSSIRNHEKVKYNETTHGNDTKGRNKKQLEEKKKQQKKSKPKLKQNKIDVKITETTFNSNFSNIETEVNTESMNEKVMKGEKYMEQSDDHKPRRQMNDHSTDTGVLCCCCKVIFTKSLRGDYTTRFGNFILCYNFLTNSLKFIKVYIIRKGISQGRQLWYYFFPKNQHFWENHKKTRFLPFFFQNRLQKNWNSKNCFGIVLLT